MKRFILAPDSFKGTLSAQEVCDIMQQAILRHIPDAQVTRVPMADGGEGMVDAYLEACGGQRVTASVTGPLGRPVNAAYGVLPDGTAVIEMAAAAGLPLAWGDKEVEERNPMITTTYGVGELIADACRRGACRVILGLGGSATSDGGIGMAAALGYLFLDRDGQPVEPVGGSLSRIDRIERPAAPLEIAVEAACDVDSPLCGPAGAAHVFGPQKGATAEQVEQLDAGLLHLSGLMQRDLGTDVADIPGAGAAGGLGAGVLAFLNGRLRAGIDMLLTSAGFDDLLARADCVFTGEGRMDGQSLRGKVPVGVAQWASRRGVPCIALCGCVEGDISDVYHHGITAVFSSLRSNAPSFEAIRRDSRGNMEYLADAVIRTLCIR